LVDLQLIRNLQSVYYSSWRSFEVHSSYIGEEGDITALHER